MTKGLFAKTGFDYRAIPINKNGKRMRGKHAPIFYACFMCGTIIDCCRKKDVFVLKEAHEKTKEHKIRDGILSKAETNREAHRAFRHGAFDK